MSDRYEREIDDILHHLEGRLRRESMWRRLSRRFRPYSVAVRAALGAFLRRPPTEQFMIGALMLVLLSLVMSMLGLGKWAFYAGVLSIALFVLGIGLSLASRHSPGYRRKRWRGREIDYGTYGPSIWSQLRRWLRRRRRY
jgi:hypothetical protein